MINLHGDAGKILVLQNIMKRPTIVSVTLIEVGQESNFDHALNFYLLHVFIDLVSINE